MNLNILLFELEGNLPIGQNFSQEQASVYNFINMIWIRVSMGDKRLKPPYHLGPNPHHASRDLFFS